MLRTFTPTWRSRARTSFENSNHQQWRLTIRRPYGSGGFTKQFNPPKAAGTGQIGYQRRSREPVLDRKTPIKCIGTVTTTAPHQTSIDSLLDQLANFEGVPARSSAGNKPALLALLLTPAYAQHALDPDFPLRAWARIKPNRKLNRPLHAVTAVVDRLPSASQDDGKGCEGLAYYFIRAMSDAKFMPSDEAALHAESTVAFPSDATKPGNLSFRVPIRDDDTQAVGSVWTFQLPLAQTLFSTGRVSTLIHSVYNPDEKSKLHLHTQRELHSHAFNLPFSSDVRTFHFPLVPLTPFRRVTNSMGNVIRTVSSEPSYQRHRQGAPELGDPIPASEELEHSVSAYFKALNIDPQAVSVWALVVPPYTDAFRTIIKTFNDAIKLMSLSLEAIQSSWSATQTEKPLYNEVQDEKMRQRRQIRIIGRSIRQLLTKSEARLCKVLSGGGGWGNKRGLLSLDPEVMYSGASQEKSASGDFEMDTEVERRKALGDVVSEGESVMFLLAPRALEEATDDPSKRTQGFSSQGQDVGNSAIFGSLPSSIDDIPQVTHAESVGSEAEIQHHPNTIGMLSEGGMAFSITDRAGRVLTQTKADVPFSWLAVAELNSPNDAVRSHMSSPTLPEGEEEGTPERDLYATPFDSERRVRLESDFDRVRDEEAQAGKMRMRRVEFEEKRRQEMEHPEAFDELVKRGLEQEGQVKKTEALFEAFGNDAVRLDDAPGVVKKFSKPWGLNPAHEKRDTTPSPSTTTTTTSGTSQSQTLVRRISTAPTSQDHRAAAQRYDGEAVGGTEKQRPDVLPRNQEVNPFTSSDPGQSESHPTNVDTSEAAAQGKIHRDPPAHHSLKPSVSRRVKRPLIGQGGRQKRDFGTKIGGRMSAVDGGPKAEGDRAEAGE